MKALSNNLLAVVYSNGLLRVIEISRTEILVETSILVDRQVEFDRIVEAQINFRTHLLVVDDNLSTSKSISLGVSFTAESSRKSTKQACLQIFSLKFNKVPYEGMHAFSQKEEERNEEMITFESGTEVILTHMQQQVFPPNLFVTSLTY